MPAGVRSKVDRAQTIATSARRPISGLSAQERADLAGVGFLRGLVAMASRGPGPHPAFVVKGPGLRYRNSDRLQKPRGRGLDDCPPMRKQSNGTPGKQPSLIP